MQAPIQIQLLDKRRAIYLYLEVADGQCDSGLQWVPAVAHYVVLACGLCAIRLTIVYGTCGKVATDFTQIGNGEPVGYPFFADAQVYQTVCRLAFFRPRQEAPSLFVFHLLANAIALNTGLGNGVAGGKVAHTDVFFMKYKRIIFVYRPFLFVLFHILHEPAVCIVYGVSVQQRVNLVVTVAVVERHAVTTTVAQGYVAEDISPVPFRAHAMGLVHKRLARVGFCACLPIVGICHSRLLLCALTAAPPMVAVIHAPQLQPARGVFRLGNPFVA